MSSTQEYKEARVQYWEQMLGFEYNSNSTKFRAFTACKALCDHVDAMKASAAYYITDYQISQSEPLQSFTDKFFDDWASQLWPNHSKCPKWLRDNGDDRLRFSRDSEDLRERLWRFVETKCMSHFKHNPEMRGTLALEPGSSPLAEQDQHAKLWANTKRSPKPARGSKRRFNGWPHGYSYVDEHDDDDEEPVFFKQERTSKTLDTSQAKLARADSAYHLRTHVTDRLPSLNADGSHESEGPPRKCHGPDHYHMTICEQRATSKPPRVPVSVNLISKRVSSHTVRQLTTPNPLRGTNKALADIQLALYIDGQNELAGVIEITDVITRDQLFDMIQQDLQDRIDFGDRFDVVRFQRTDGEAFPRPNARSVPIKRFGQHDMWKAMVKTMLEHNIGDLEGFVIVKRGVDSK